MRSVFIIIGILVYSMAYSQKNLGIKSKTITEVEVGKENAGIKELKQEFDDRGNIIKEFDYNKEGELKHYEVYAYNASNLKTSETRFDPKGKIIHKFTYEYNSRGDKTVKFIYNDKNQLVKKKIYAYEYY